MTQESSSGANAPEEDAETLLREIGRVLLDDAAATAWMDERFEAWLFQSADADLFSHETDRDDAELERLGTALLARIAARRRELRRLHVPPTDLDPPLIATPLRSVDAARVYAAAPVIDLAVAAGTGREIWDEPVRRWVRIPQEVPEGRYVVFPIAGDSLSPLVHSGDQVLVQLDTEPQGIVEKIGDVAGVPKRAAKADLKRFKEFIEARGTETGAWRGDVPREG